ncbi:MULTISPECIES: choice-of-anchor V domain-containing protein [unclassified Iodidimonas]|jgi:hypothetical protein|uniref:choice-of-anchor V domain-containing protein n=1 Tax=unclassified Iodidimonas TaxID=2626145 RepID=UPI002482A8F3|nr:MULTISPECIES: choice-of-anchor V domain-containing protein [unclassified Iodidimonas]
MPHKSYRWLAIPVLCAGIALIVIPRWPSMAYSDGPPWYSVQERDGCASCHWGRDVVRNSVAIKLQGLPDTVMPGMSYDLQFSFNEGDPNHLGFLAGVMADKKPVGLMKTDWANIHTNQSSARSGSPDFSQSNHHPGQWTLTWTAPDTLSQIKPLELIIWVNQADGGGSQMGDIIHQKTITLKTQ